MKKLTLSLIAVILFTMFGLGWAIDQLFSQYQDNDQEVSTSGQFTPYITLGASLAKLMDKQTSTQQFITNWENSQQLSLSVISLLDFPLPASLQQSFIAGKPLLLESDDNISIHFILPKHQQVMTLIVDRTLTVKDNSEVKFVLTLVFYLGIIIILFIWLYPLIRDLQNLKRAAKKFGRGDLVHRVSSENSSYIADLQSEFNNMANRIATLVSDNEMLGNAVAHDLRTPLARLRFGIEMLQDTDDDTKRKKYENRMNSDINEMEKLVDVLLCYARLEQNMVIVDKHEVDLQLLTQECITLFQVEENNVVWSVDIQSSPLVVSGDAKYLRMLINNLLKNAVQYSKKQIKVSLSNESSQVILTVEDDGIGIPKSKRITLLKPFARGSDNSEITGFGMGLAIVDRITHWHNAELFIDESLALGGAKFIVVFSQSE